MVYFLIDIVATLIRILQFMMFARAIFSWFPQMQNSSIVEFLYMVTEPVIMPVRGLLNRIPSIRMMPIDLAFFCTFILLEFIQLMLYNLY
ncbi:MAG TPA: YggT family protein [Candidatus Butyricicoccus avistercoris]|uniref:YggT family protein n=1 Tax=Candidatus Butyricicoccus avistercoris TaxID=2838518 RepID=A0A9D1PK50_9FIRM|nr:YggT family protein [Candidatus Butyricicoccus avistercoris]